MPPLTAMMLVWAFAVDTDVSFLDCCSRHFPGFCLFLYQDCTGVRESGHFSARTSHRGWCEGSGIESYTKVDLRTVSFSVPPQEILTRDSVTVSVDAVVYYRISNATVSVANVENAHHSTRLLAQTTLRNMLGTRNLAEILSDRDNIACSMQTLLDEATDSWGIKVERVEIKDVRLPVQLQRAMAAEAEATREARAKVIAAEGEQKASRSLHEAAEVIAQSPAAIQLRYLQTLNSIAAERNSTIIFPLPIELIRHVVNNC
uniref:Band 7 domain-containing protein n=1 Tax=Ditylenchus dipsaci TaxID=166011 RepID=A0A915E202_9BILA